MFQNGERKIFHETPIHFCVLTFTKLIHQENNNKGRNNDVKTQHPSLAINRKHPNIHILSLTTTISDYKTDYGKMTIIAINDKDCFIFSTISQCSNQINRRIAEFEDIDPVETFIISRCSYRWKILSLNISKVL